jgi:uncharacterized HhH-GPD family protein
MSPLLPDIGSADGPLEFLIGIISNQAIRAESAWKVAAGLRDRLGHLDAERLAEMHESALAAAIGQRSALHPFARSMGRYITGTCRMLCDIYDARASALWDDTPAASTIISRLTAFPGIGRHKAEVALFLLVREYGIAVTEDRPVDTALSHCARLAETFGPLPPDPPHG